MVNDPDADAGSSRRGLLTALGAASVTLAGCADALPFGSGPGDGPDFAEDTDADRWPGIDAGLVLSDFETLEDWTPQSDAAEVSAAPDEARIGSQAAVIESDEGTAGATFEFPEAVDLTTWDLSLAVKPESADRIAVEIHAPTAGKRLTTVRSIPDGFDGWFRLDCGYQQKPGGDPDLTDVTAIQVVAHGPDGGPTRLLLDDLRQTRSAANGAAILVFQGGHQSHYDVAAEMLAERDWAAAVPVTPEQIGEAGRMGRDELRELSDRGWDVCSLPAVSTPLPDQPADRQRQVFQRTRDALASDGFEDGARHLFVPDGGMNTDTYDAARDVYESAFRYSDGTTAVPPTEMHMIPYIWGPALHTGVRRHTNLSDQYNLLTAIRVPRIVDAEDVGVDENRMSLDDFGLLLDHIEHRGLDVITPSDLVDEEFERADGDTGESSPEQPSGTIVEAGQSHSFEGSGSQGTSTFDLDEGAVIANVSHDGSSITVDVTDVDGSGRGETLLTTSGNATGESIATVESGTYELDVDADGAWSIELTQPAVDADELSDLPVQTSGTGSSFVGPLLAEGRVRVEATHDGDGQFVVDGHGADGSREILVYRTGSFDNSRSYKASGAVWVNVEADGDWTLDIVDS